MPVVVNPYILIAPPVGGGGYALGGVISEDGAYTVHVFTGSEDLTVVGTVIGDWLLAGGGGGAGYSNSSAYFGGGGGAGRLLLGFGEVLLDGVYPVVAGAGGAQGGTSTDGSNGGDSSWNSYVAPGGGGGGRGSTAFYDPALGNGHDGGSGGGGFGARTGTSPTGGAPINGTTQVGYGNAGGSGSGDDSGHAAGGGGAGGVGQDGSTGGAALGGAGLANSITGSSLTYAKGGNAGTGSPASAPPSGRGSGGNGGSAGTAGTPGSSGTFILRYVTPTLAPTPDPYWTMVSALIQGSTDIVDSKGHTVNLLGSPGPVLDGSGHITMVNTGTITVSAGGKRVFAPEYGPFCVEGFINADAGNTNYNTLFDTSGNGSAIGGFFGEFSTVRGLFWGENNSSYKYAQDNIFVSGARHHVFISRDSNGNVCIGRNGVITATVVCTDKIPNSPGLLGLGQYTGGGSNGFMGTMDNVRFTKGHHRYSGAVSATYHIPALPMPVIGPDWATWNPDDMQADVRLYNGNLEHAYVTRYDSAVRATVGKRTGKWSWETTMGLTDVSDSTVAAINFGVWPASRAISTYPYLTTGVTRVVTPVAGDVYTFDWDADASILYVRKNGTTYDTISGLTDAEPWHPYCGDDNKGDSDICSMVTNFGQAPFIYPPRTGHVAGLYDTVLPPAPAFDPRSLPGIVSWFDVSAVNGKVVNRATNKISYLLDLSGSHNHAVQLTPSLQYDFAPHAINGLDCAVGAGGVGMNLQTGVTIPNYSFWAFAVAKHNGENIILTTSSTSSYGLDSAPGGMFYAWAGSGSGRSLSGLGSGTSDNTLHMMGINASGSATDMYFDGTTGTSAAVTGIAWGSLHSYPAAGYNLNGSFCELIVGTSPLSTADVSHLIGYLKSKWGTP